MLNVPPKPAGSLWRSQRIHLMDISRASDNGPIRSDRRQHCLENDNRTHKLFNPEPHRCYYNETMNRPLDISTECDMSFSPTRLYNDESEFSDTSASYLCNSTTTFIPIDPYQNDYCYERTHPNEDFKSRRKLMSRSLILDQKYRPIPMNSEWSDRLSHQERNSSAMLHEKYDSYLSRNPDALDLTMMDGVFHQERDSTGILDEKYSGFLPLCTDQMAESDRFFCQELNTRAITTEKYNGYEAMNSGEIDSSGRCFHEEHGSSFILDEKYNGCLPVDSRQNSGYFRQERSSGILDEKYCSGFRKSDADKKERSHGFFRPERVSRDSDSSSSSCSTTPLRTLRRKPKQNRKSTPHNFYCSPHNKQAVIGHPPPLPPKPLYSTYVQPRPWIAVQPEDNLQKVQDLESDKKSLILQASVLADRVDAQADKIGELERLLDKKKDELIRLEQNLHQEALARSSVENSKLELMTELSNLRLRLTAAERDRKESDEKYRKLECDLVAFQTRVIEHDTEHSLLNGTLSRNGPRNHDVDIEKLKTALDSVIISNDEKDQKIENLKSTLTKYKKLQDVLSSHSKNAENSLRDVKSFDSNQTISSLNNDVKQSSFGIGKSHGYSSSISHVINQSSQSHCSSNLHNSLTASSLHKSNSEENISQSALIATPNSQYGTMPRQTGNQVLQQLQVQLKEHEANTNCNLVSAAKSGERINGENSLKIGIRNTNSRGKSSGVSFAAEECITIPSTEKDVLTFAPPLTPQPYLIKSEKDKKGFLKFLSKFKKTGSQNIDRIEGDFKRGGIRATAGPRLGWSRDLSEDPDIPFPRWNTDLVVEWLHKLGLSMYVGECKRWMCNGEMLINASGNDLEKELVIKNPLHKKKLMLAIKRMNSSVPNLPPSINNLDYHWVVRWLDDVGLPQYKDSFAEARVDGHVLHCLTVDDLLYLKVFSQLHHVSICRGIQVLREKGFDPHCLVRRSLPDEGKTYCPQFVALWSNHRVMEWLRTVDLSEYAPNLRGSGVHGALIVHEPKFNTNLFASLLNIPPTKTLLRRHLATHFKHIIGDELTQIKREKENDAPLSPSVKIKAVRKTQFALKKKRNKNEIENEDYVCPMDIPVINETPKVLEADKLVVRRNSDPSPQEQKHLDLKIILEVDATERIGAVSKENPPLNTIHPDENLNESPTTIV